MGRWVAALVVCASCSQETAPGGTPSHLPFAPICHPPARNGTFVADSCPPPPSGRLVAGTDFQRVVANYDNCPAFVDGSGGLWAVDENGNTEQVVTGSFGEAVAGPRSLTIFYNDHNYDKYNYDGKLAFWRRASGTVLLGVSGPLRSSFTDENWVAFLAEWELPANRGSLAVAALDCSSNQVLRGLDDYDTILMSGGRVLAGSYYRDLTVRSYDPDTGQGGTMFTDSSGVLLATRAGAVLAPNDGMPLIYPATGGSPVSIGGGQPLYPGAFTHAGDAVIGGNDRAVVRAPIDGGATTVLLPALGVLALSPDDKWMVYDTRMCGNLCGGARDAWLTSATKATLPVALADGYLVAAPEYLGAPPTVGFTEDSAWVYWYDTGQRWHLHAVDGSSVDRTIDNAHRLTTAAGARLVWDDNAGSVWAVDLAGGGAPVMLAQSSASWALSTDKKTVYYLQSDGLYAAPFL